jgi:prepilin-type processing-associated H-X9-DG protein
MPIPFTCPHCGRRTEADDVYAGQTGPCAGCGRAITVPGTASDHAFSPPAKKSSGTLVTLVVVGAFAVLLVCGGLLVALWLPAVQEAPEAARRMQCVNNLKQIGVAMHNYHDVYRCFPPAYVPDADGKPMHSWRVLILPFLEQQSLYDQYDFNEPWDGPNNIRLADSIPAVYACPDSVFSNSNTCYAMIVGPDTISDGPSAARLADIKDGTANTLMVVEAAGNGINWMEPRDLDAQKLSFVINDRPTPGGIKSDHPGGANVVFCDGAVRFLPDTTSPGVVKDLSTIAGGERIPEF